jgi:hypothetical protein
MFDQLSLEHSSEHQNFKTSIFDPSPVPCYLWDLHVRLGGMLQEMVEDSDLIFIPQEAGGQSIAGFTKSVRLTHVLQSKGVQLFGELHGLTYLEFATSRNCGQKTLQELRELVRTVQQGQAGTVSGFIIVILLSLLPDNPYLRHVEPAALGARSAKRDHWVYCRCERQPG